MDDLLDELREDLDELEATTPRQRRALRRLGYSEWAIRRLGPTKAKASALIAKAVEAHAQVRPIPR